MIELKLVRSCSAISGCMPKNTAESKAAKSPSRGLLTKPLHKIKRSFASSKVAPAIATNIPIRN